MTTRSGVAAVVIRPNDSRLRSAILFALVFLLYFIARSPGLDEKNSIELAMNVRHFDFANGQPPAIGHPLFVLCGWLAQECLRCGPNLSFHIASAIGGALFVAVWFLIVRAHFDAAFAWMFALTLCVVPIVWMSATQALPDALSAGLFSAGIWCALFFKWNDERLALFAISGLGAAAVGVEPQLCAVVMLVMMISLWQRRARGKNWLLAFGIFSVGCLLWLLPLWPLHVRLHLEMTAADVTFSDLAQGFVANIMGWFAHGLGFSFSATTLFIGTSLALIGAMSTVRRRAKLDAPFWKKNWPWAALLIATIFYLPSTEQSFSLLVIPLLLVVLMLGFFRLPGRWKYFAVIWPAFLICILAPLAVENHTEKSPAIRVVEYLENLYSPAERGKVLLLLRESLRQFQWFAPKFEISSADALADIDAKQIASSTAIYTDNPNLKLPPGRLLQPIAHFERSDLINSRQAQIDLFRIDSVESEIGEQIILKPRPKSP